MKTEILNKIIELQKQSNWITTNQLLKELNTFGNSTNILNSLIDKEIPFKILEFSLYYSEETVNLLKRYGIVKSI